MRKVTLCMFLTMLMVCLTLPGPVGSGKAAETIKIGLVCSTSGWAAALGAMQKEAFVAVVEDINRKGGIAGKQVEPFIEDDKSGPEGATAAATKLVREAKVSILVGTTNVQGSIALAAFADKEQIPVVTTSPAMIPFSKWIFPVGPGDVRMTAHTLELTVNTFGAKRIALLHDTAGYGMGGAKILNQEISQYPGVSFVIQESFDVKSTDVTPQLTKIKAANPDALIIYSTGAANAVVAKTYKQLGMKMPVVGAGGLAAPDFLKEGGPVAEELKWAIMVLRVSVAGSLSPADPYRKIVFEPMQKVLQDKYGADKTLTVFHASPIDALTMISLAVKAAGSDDRAAVRDAMEKTKFQGLLGTMAPGPTDHQEGAKDTSVLGMLKGGKFVPYAK